MSGAVYSFKTISKETAGRFQSRGSKFLAFAFPLADIESLEQRIAQLKSEHPKARHYCYAYRILFDESIREYSSDDGEPSGSAGKPILAAIKSADLLNIGCVVLRYFGGTKLGIPGLIEAYRESTKDALQDALVLTTRRTGTYRMTLPMKLQPHILESCKRMELEVSNPAYSQTFQLTVHIPLEHEESTLDALLKMLSARDYESVKEYEQELGMKIEKLD